MKELVAREELEKSEQLIKQTQAEASLKLEFEGELKRLQSLLEQKVAGDAQNRSEQKDQAHVHLEHEREALLSSSARVKEAWSIAPEEEKKKYADLLPLLQLQLKQNETELESSKVLCVERDQFEMQLRDLEQAKEAQELKYREQLIQLAEHFDAIKGDGDGKTQIAVADMDASVPMAPPLTDDTGAGNVDTKSVTVAGAGASAGAACVDDLLAAVRTSKAAKGSSTSSIRLPHGDNHLAAIVKGMRLKPIGIVEKQTVIPPKTGLTLALQLAMASIRDRVKPDLGHDNDEDD